jgi:hypothetical protein
MRHHGEAREVSKTVLFLSLRGVSYVGTLLAPSVHDRWQSNRKHESKKEEPNMNPEQMQYTAKLRTTAEET